MAINRRDTEARSAQSKRTTLSITSKEAWWLEECLTDKIVAFRQEVKRRRTNPKEQEAADKLEANLNLLLDLRQEVQAAKNRVDRFF